MNIEIANRLVNLRKSNHLSQEALAEKLGISRQAVSKWERAEASPDTDNLIMLARLYKVSLDELLRTDEEILPRESGEIQNADGGLGREESPNVDGEPGIGESPNVDGEPGREEFLNVDGEPGREEIPNGDGELEREEIPNEDGQPGIGESPNGDGRPGREEPQNADDRPERGESQNVQDQPHNGKSRDEYADIGFDGIHIKDRDGSKVHIGWDGIHVEDAKKGDNVDVDRNGVYINGEKKEFWSFSPAWDIPFSTLICITYLILGFLFGAWHPGWLLFLLIPIWYSFVSAVKKKNANVFAYPVFVTFVYLCAGFFLDLWHPGWILYLTIPIYYSFASGTNSKK